MIRATRVIAGGGRSTAAADTVVLDYDQRHRRRVALTGSGGLAFLLDLAEAFPLRDGDGLLLEDGRIVAVSAAPEPLAEITADDPAQLLRVALHLGNRHLAVEVGLNRILVRRDHVIEAMVAGLGATVRHIDAPFDPEGGAYAAGHRHHADDHHGDRHHDHAPRHNPALDHDDRIEDEEPGNG